MRAFELESKNPELYARCRRYAGHTIFLLAAVALLISSVTNNPIGEFLFLLCGAAACAVMVIAKWRVSEVKNEFPGGKIVAYEFDPHPINSLVKNLRKYVPISSIQTIKLMSSDIEKSDNYYNSGHDQEKSLVQILRDECPNAKVMVYGPCEIPDLKSKNSQIEFVLTNGPLKTHTNLITTDDERSFVWYEPYHDIKGSKHIFTAGAYLIAINADLKKVVEKKYDELASKSPMELLSIH